MSERVSTPTRRDPGRRTAGGAQRSAPPALPAVVTAEPGSIVPPGTVLAGRYAVSGMFPRRTLSSESYLCTWRSRPFVAKVYAEGSGFTKESANALTQVSSPYVARILKAGQWNGHPFQISHYYRNGSLEGRTLDAETIMRQVVPQLNRGLNALHAHAIVHGGLQPSNILIGDDPKQYLIADYGRLLAGDSEVRDLEAVYPGANPREVFFTAPEAAAGRAVPASDYYSLGIVLFVLYTGRLPVELPRNVDILAPRFDFPSDMPPRLRDLIIGLTHSDLSNQSNAANPNRRWTYAEVRRWCAGDTLPVPIESFGPGAAIPPFEFEGHQYTSMGSLVAAMAVQWDAGKEQLLGGGLRSFLEATDPTLARVCERAEVTAGHRPDAADAVYLEYLYRLSPDLQNLYWRGECLGTLDDVGKLFLRDSVTPELMNMTGQGALTGYMRARHPEPSYLARTMSDAEREFANPDVPAAQRAVARRVISRLLSQDFQLTVDNQIFDDVHEFATHCLELRANQTEAWQELSERLVPRPGHLEPTFEAWLRALGNDDAVASWASGRGNLGKAEPGAALQHHAQDRTTKER